MGRVVVGIDGSEGARRALQFAVDEARMRDATLEVVHVMPPPPARAPVTQGLQAEYVSADMYADFVEVDRDEAERLQVRARQAGEHVLDAAVDAVPHDGVAVERTLLFDRRPARRLVQLLTDHDDVELLVIGSRGRGELTNRLLGSVSQACVNHARVPVTVVHGPPQR